MMVILYQSGAYLFYDATIRAIQNRRNGAPRAGEMVNRHIGGAYLCIVVRDKTGKPPARMTGHRPLNQLTIMNSFISNTGVQPTNNNRNFWSILVQVLVAALTALAGVMAGCQIAG